MKLVADSNVGTQFTQTVNGVVCKEVGQQNFLELQSEVSGH